MAKVPGMDGAFDLRQLRDSKPRTLHETTFYGCQVGITQIVDTEGQVKGYQLKIGDQRENHLYVFPFEETLRQELIGMLMDLTPVGEVADEG